MACGVGTGPATAVQLVEGKYSDLTSLANEAYANTFRLLSDLQSQDISFEEVVAEFTAPAGHGTVFNYQAPPEDPNIVYDFSGIDVPLLPVFNTIDPPEFKSAPSLTATKPGYDIPGSPTLTIPTHPGDAPEVSDVTIPDPPNVSGLLPEVPTLEEINLPEVPDISLPTFSGTNPVGIPDIPTETFSFSDEEYSSELFDELVVKIRNWLEGGTGIPDIIWTSIWDRAREKNYISAQKELSEAAKRYSSKGFSYPTGAYNSVVQEIRQGILNSESELAREMAIKSAEMEQTNLHFAIQQGIALENITIVLFNDRMKRALEAAKYAFDAAVNIFDTKVKLYNLGLESYKTDAQVYKTLIEAELSRLEAYKAELEGQKLVNEVNNQSVALYNSQLQSVLTHIEIYKGQLAGVTAQVELDKSRVDIFLAQVQAYAEQFKANTIQVQAYAEQIKAETAKGDLYKTEIDAFNAEIAAYSAETDLESKRKEIEIAFQDSQIRKYTAELEKYKSELSTEVERIRAAVSVYDGKAKIYATEISQEEARVRANSDQWNLAIEEAKTDAELDLQAAKTNVENLLKTLNLELQRMDTLAKVQGDLAKSALMAFNVGATIQANSLDAENKNYSCS